MKLFRYVEARCDVTLAEIRQENESCEDLIACLNAMQVGQRLSFYLGASGTATFIRVE